MVPTFMTPQASPLPFSLPASFVWIMPFYAERDDNGYVLSFNLALVKLFYWVGFGIGSCQFYPSPTTRKRTYGLVLGGEGGASVALSLLFCLVDLERKKTHGFLPCPCNPSNMHLDLFLGRAVCLPFWSRYDVIVFIILPFPRVLWL